MRKLLLLSGMSAIAFAAMAEDAQEPKKFENSCAYALAPNGSYIVSEGTSGIKIINALTGQVNDYSIELGEGVYTPGIGKCVSSNGIVVGSSEEDAAVYWKDGEWNILEVPSGAVFSNHANAITPDGSRICGIMGNAAVSYDDDVLMMVPVVWCWNEEKGDYDLPVLLPHPDTDFTGRIPQYVTAVDISEDGKTVVGQIMTATGMYRYPIIYTENEAGEWSYVLPDEKGLYPEGVTFPEYPGDAPVYPAYETFMTADEIDAYNAAIEEYYNVGDWEAPYPDYHDFMSAEGLAEFDKAMAEYEVEFAEWDEKFMAWMDINNEITRNNPNYEFNSIRVSPDGKKYANTIMVVGEQGPDDWFPPTYDHIWVFDIETGAITKYGQQDDFTLTFLGENGVAMAVANKLVAPKSYVLKNGECTEMQAWIAKTVPDYTAWMEENLTFEVMEEFWNPAIEDWDLRYNDVVLTGRAYATPDLSMVVLGIDNVWDYLDDGVSVLFDMGVGARVAGIDKPVEESTIYDLNGRKLKNADAPGIYIINGQKKVVR